MTEERRTKAQLLEAIDRLERIGGPVPNVKQQPYLQIDIPDPDAASEDELDSISAMPIKDHYAIGIRKWLVGHECSGIYFSIYDGEIDTWIQLFEAMKQYEGEQARTRPASVAGSTNTTLAGDVEHHVPALNVGIEGRDD